MKRGIATQLTLSVSLFLNLAVVIVLIISHRPPANQIVHSGPSNSHHASIVPPRGTEMAITSEKTGNRIALVLTGLSLCTLLALAGVIRSTQVPGIPLSEYLPRPTPHTDQLPLHRASPYNDSKTSATAVRNTQLQVESNASMDGLLTPSSTVVLPDILRNGAQIGAGLQTSQNRQEMQEWLLLVKECVSLFDEVDRVVSPDQPLASHVRARLQEILERAGVETIDSEEKFDRHRHQLNQPTHLPAQGARIASINSPGFAADGQVLRRAHVHLADAPID